MKSTIGDRASELAYWALGKGWDDVFPVEVASVSAACGYPMVEAQRASQAAFGKGQERLIVVDGRLQEGARRFWAAHALGHFMLGHGPMPAEEWPRMGGRLDWREAQADSFALALTMPESELRLAASSRSSPSLASLEAFFGVEPWALMSRMECCGIS